MLVYTKKCYKQKKCDEWLKIRDERSNCRSSLIFDHSSRKKKKSQIKGGIVSNIKKGFSAMKAGGEQHKKVNSEYGKIKRKRRTHF